jgi:hypothetical protein
VFFARAGIVSRVANNKTCNKCKNIKNVLIETKHILIFWS